MRSARTAPTVALQRKTSKAGSLHHPNPHCSGRLLMVTPFNRKNYVIAVGIMISLSSPLARHQSAIHKETSSPQSLPSPISLSESRPNSNVSIYCEK